MALQSSSSKNLLVPLLTVLALVIVIPALMLGLTNSQDVRSKAAYSACSAAAPCRGQVAGTTTQYPGWFIFKGVDGVSYYIRSLMGVNVGAYNGRNVMIVGNLTRDPAIKTFGQIYVTSMSVDYLPGGLKETKCISYKYTGQERCFGSKNAALLQSCFGKATNTNDASALLCKSYDANSDNLVDVSDFSLCSSVYKCNL